MDMLQSATDWLNATRKQFLSTAIKYVHYNGRHDSFESVLLASRGRSIFKSENGYGITIRVHSEDFIVSAADIDFEPQKGDEIFCNGRKYEVLAPNDEPVYRWCDADHKALRIHSKDMGEE